MKNRIGNVIARLSLLISCSWVAAGCVMPREHIRVDSAGTLMQPRFHLYRNQYSQKRSNIKEITVWKQRSVSVIEKPADFQTVWHLTYKVSDNFMKNFFGQLWISPVCCLTYGEVPPGYREIVKAQPLDPEQLYWAAIHKDTGISAENMSFIIRLDAKGNPNRLEYRLTEFFYINRRDDLRLE